MRTIKRTKGISCVNHPDNIETQECERCHKYFCQECLIEDWSENFYQQFLGKKRQFTSKIYCRPCQKRVNRARVITSIILLTLLISPLLLWALVAITSI